MNPLLELEQLGQSAWLDNISRGLITSGALKRLIEEDGISGITSNPTIFEKAISHGTDYDAAMRELIAQGASDADIYDALTIADIQAAADVLHPVFDATHGGDGYVSLEVSPKLARDAAGTLTDARRLHAAVNRPNLFIKVPATREGIPAIRQLLSEGINVNVTLMFSMEHYEAVAEAYIAALEDRVRQALPIGDVASVASFFVSRVDTLVDKLLEDKVIAQGSLASKAVALRGQIAVANSKLVYQRFKEIFDSERFKALEAQGARVQRVLWASTSTKNPAYNDVLYVETLIGPDTVNTLPDETLVTFRNHGQARATVEEGLAEARAAFQALAELGIDLRVVGEQLSVEGVSKFAQSFDKLFAVIAAKRQVLAADVPNRLVLALSDEIRAHVDETLDVLERENFVRRLWARDASLWKTEPERQQDIVNRLGWLTIADTMLERVGELTAFADEIKQAGFKYIVLLGMGGSSLAPEVYRDVFGIAPGYPQLIVLDSTAPATIGSIDRKIKPARTLFLVSSKSGDTIETLSFYKYFADKVRAVDERNGDWMCENFVVITDPGTVLEKQVREAGCRRFFLAPPDVGGRFSALTNFGLVPAALIGVDVKMLLERAIKMARACGPEVKLADNPGIFLGVALGELWKLGRDKLTFITSPSLSSFGYWVEQLVAESTGKEGRGILPVEGEPFQISNIRHQISKVFGRDRAFVHLKLEGEDAQDRRVAALEAAGYPVIHVVVRSKIDLAQEFFRWEFATAVAGALLGIDPFDQPNVAESKDNTKRLLADAKRVAKGKLPERGVATKKSEWVESLAGLLKRVRPGDYVALLAYLEKSPGSERTLRAIRKELRDAFGVAVTVGYGPRFLHSTGQLHKGGANNGVFIQITADAVKDVAIPGEPYTFGTLIRAQAVGDLQALKSHKRRAVRIHLGEDVKGDLRQLQESVHKAIAQSRKKLGAKRKK
jgi:transaldolase/glucose-6-phosphate isomerase